MGRLPGRSRKIDSDIGLFDSIQMQPSAGHDLIQLMLMKTESTVGLMTLLEMGDAVGRCSHRQEHQYGGKPYGNSASCANSDIQT
ncbi:hypothetical protein GCM10007107_02430 [Shewanella indica]|nr:hypothetical protein GCM10007107_02430 [Shewanella indica]